MASELFPDAAETLSISPKRFFSVVIPLYNKEKSVKLALGSVLSQTHDAFEIIVVDDGSTDSSPSIVAAMRDARLRLVHQPNSGAAAARNAGARIARSDFIAFIDADDYWKPDFLETINRLVDIHPGAGFYATAYQREEKNGRLVTLKLAPCIAAMQPGRMQNYFHAATFGEEPFIPSSTCILRNAFESLGGFKAGVKIGEDLDIFARVALRYDIIYTPEPKALYRRTAENRVTSSPFPLTPWAFHGDAAQLLASGKLNPDIARDLVEHLADVDLRTAATNLTNPDSQAVLAFLRGIHTKAFLKRKRLIAAFMLLPLPLRKAIIAAKRRM
jgi:glycosyltransferase involved in cell wall biosynthesis